MLAEFGDVFLDCLAHVSEGQHEVMVLVNRIVPHDVPKEGPATDFHKRLWAYTGFLNQPGTLSPGEYCYFQITLLPKCAACRAGIDMWY